MSTKHWTEAEWRAHCAREWPHLRLATADRSPLETKELARGAALEARIAELEARLHALERRRR